MNTDSSVVVYSFRVPDGSERLGPIESFKAPRDLIVQRFRGEVLEGTGEKVDIGALDAEGRYRRIATGWGELPE